MNRTFIKICGITTVDDARAAVAGGADALGFVFHPASPRAIDPNRAATITAALGPFVTTVALFVDANATLVDEVLAVTGIHVAQFHGAESPVWCAAIRRPWIKAIRMAPGVDGEIVAARYGGASAWLFDAWHPQQAGGTGNSFDWSRLPATPARPLILAGGLAPENVAEAIARVQPYAVDVSSGVERAPGRKDPAKIRAFVAAVRAADARRGDSEARAEQGRVE